MPVAAPRIIGRFRGNVRSPVVCHQLGAPSGARGPPRLEWGRPNVRAHLSRLKGRGERRVSGVPQLQPQRTALLRDQTPADCRHLGCPRHLAGVVLGVIAHRRPRLRNPILATAGLILTIPSLALYALLVVPLGFGSLPVVVALVVYSSLPITPDHRHRPAQRRPGDRRVRYRHGYDPTPATGAD